MANEAEHRRWNDPYWSSVWPRREALTDLVTATTSDAFNAVYDLLLQMIARDGTAPLAVVNGHRVRSGDAITLDGKSVRVVAIHDDSIELDDTCVPAFRLHVALRAQQAVHVLTQCARRRERGHAGQHLVQDHAQRVHVRSVVDVPALAALLG